MMHDKKNLLSGSVNHKFKAEHNEVDAPGGGVTFLWGAMESNT
jgi:hypothetical protein